MELRADAMYGAAGRTFNCRINGLEVCYWDTRPAGLNVNPDTGMIKNRPYLRVASLSA